MCCSQCFAIVKQPKVVNPKKAQWEKVMASQEDAEFWRRRADEIRG